MMFSRIPRRTIVGRRPNITVKLDSARLVGSFPRLQAQVADLAKIPVREAISTVRPVARALPQDRDEF